MMGLRTIIPSLVAAATKFQTAACHVDICVVRLVW